MVALPVVFCWVSPVHLYWVLSFSLILKKIIMIILGIIGPTEIVLFMILIIIGSYIYTINRAAKNIRRHGGSKRIKILKWLFIAIIVMMSYILFSMQIFGSFSILILVAGLGAIIGVSRYRPSSLPEVRN
jgi:hypothetical protein